MKETKCINSLEWFIRKSESDNWKLHHDNQPIDIMGIIERFEDGYRFIPLLYNGCFINQCINKKST